VRRKGLRCLQGQLSKVGEEKVLFSLMLGRRFMFQFLCLHFMTEYVTAYEEPD
jgi:hypothetical protein